MPAAELDRRPTAEYARLAIPPARRPLLPRIEHEMASHGCTADEPFDYGGGAGLPG